MYGSYKYPTDWADFYRFRQLHRDLIEQHIMSDETWGLNKRKIRC